MVNKFIVKPTNMLIQCVTPPNKILGHLIKCSLITNMPYLFLTAEMRRIYGCHSGTSPKGGPISSEPHILTGVPVHIFKFMIANSPYKPPEEINMYK